MKKTTKFLLMPTMLLGASLASCGEKGGPYITYTLDSDIEVKAVENDIELVSVPDLPGKFIAHKNRDNADFKVLTFTDLHLDHNQNTCNYTFSMMARNIINVKPDFIVFCGDNITSSYNEPRTKQFGELLEKLGVYWCAVLGNHEKNATNPNCIERDRMINIWCQYPHCLIDNTSKKTTEGTTVWGNGNSLVNLYSNKGITQSIYFLDSGTEMTAAQMDEYCEEICDYKIMKKCSETETEFYDYIKNSQVMWYQETFSNIRSAMKKQEKQVPHSTIISHVPIIEQEDAYLELFNKWEEESKLEKSGYGGSNKLRVFTDYPQNREDCKDVNQLYNTQVAFVKGERNRRCEDLCYSPHDLRYKNAGKRTPILNAMKIFGNNNAFFCGHDHSNNYTIKCDGQFLGYVQSGCYSSNNLYTKGLLGADPYKPDEEEKYGGHLSQGYTELIYKQSSNNEFNIIDSITVKENYKVWKETKPELYTRALDLVKDQLLTGKKKVYVDSRSSYLDGK